MQKMISFKEIKAKYPLGGRPKSFRKPEDMIKKLYEYLESQENRLVVRYTKDGQEEINSKGPITVEGFCAFAGITKTTFYDYRKKKGFAEVIEQFRQIVEKYFVEQLVEGKPGNKADFVLKNAFSEEWKEKSTLTVDSVDGIVLKVLDKNDCGNENSSDIQTTGEPTEEI